MFLFDRGCTGKHAILWHRKIVGGDIGGGFRAHFDDRVLPEIESATPTHSKLFFKYICTYDMLGFVIKFD